MSDDQFRNPDLPVRDGSTDPWLQLEDVTDDDALERVREHNARTEQELDVDGEAATLVAELKMILGSPASIPSAMCHGDQLYNFWTDVEHPRGLWRRTLTDSYRVEEPDWEVLIDVDALNAVEQEDRVWHDAIVPRLGDGQPWRHALITLSHGGSDADVTREFDLVTKRLVPASESGFEQSATKDSLSWIDSDTVFVAADSGPESVGSSGCPLQVRR